VAVWDGDRLTVHDATQWPDIVRATLAAAFAGPGGNVRVLAPFVGGGFGAGRRAWPHVILTALAARTVDRPVKLVLTRPQMFTGVGHRPTTVQHLRLGATREGELVALDHLATASVAMADDNLEPIAAGTANGYASQPDHPRPAAAAQHPTPRPRCAPPGDGRATSRWSPRWTSWPTP
jgi:CO/xanthine dehydrogenase Mo-binding subunit